MSCKIKVGDWYVLGPEVYILASVGDSKVCLISLSNGNRYSEGVYVSRTLDIDPIEFNRICARVSSRFKPITKPMEITKYNNIGVE
jgi:hypothetical protein